MSGFDSKWDAMAAKNPALSCDDTKITLPVRELKRLLRKFYNHGEEAVMPIGNKMADLLSKFGEVANGKRG